ncbi:MAG: ankyrin repeat domain-containing protein [Candidatus Limnocylindrales bacterium]
MTDDLIAAVRAGDATRVGALLAVDPALANARDASGVSAILLSRYRSDRATTDALLAADPDLDVFEAAALGYADRLGEDLEADPRRAVAVSSDGFTALHLAAYFGKAEAARLLIDNGSDVNAVSANEMRVQPLHSAAAGGHRDVCRILLAAGADVNATQRDSYAPIHAAAQHGDDELVELFLSAGADPTARIADGSTPADVAEAAGHPDVAARLRSVASAG